MALRLFAIFKRELLHYHAELMRGARQHRRRFGPPLPGTGGLDQPGKPVRGSTLNFIARLFSGQRF